MTDNAMDVNMTAYEGNKAGIDNCSTVRDIDRTDIDRIGSVSAGSDRINSSSGSAGNGWTDSSSDRTDRISAGNDRTNSSSGSAGSDAVPMVSISCISFNHADYIREALDSFLMQETTFPIEILIHDDASTDGTVDIIREYEASYPDIIVPMYEEQNQYSRGISNISGTFNFPRARGRYIAMCEGDDFWKDPHKLQRQVEYMEAHPECAMCCHASGIVSMDKAFRSVDSLRPFPQSGIIAAEAVISKKENIPMASLLFRTEYAKALPQWYFDCPVGDIPLQLAMLMHGNVYYMDEIMSMYRMGRAGSWGHSMDSGEAALKWEKHYAAMERLYGAFNRDTADRYKEATAEALRRSRFLIDIKEDKLEAVLDKENAKYLSELPDTEQRLLRLKAKHRWLYEMLRWVYLKLYPRNS